MVALIYNQSETDSVKVSGIILASDQLSLFFNKVFKIPLCGKRFLVTATFLPLTIFWSTSPEIPLFRDKFDKPSWIVLVVDFQFLTNSGWPQLGFGLQAKISISKCIFLLGCEPNGAKLILAKNLKIYSPPQSLSDFLKFIWALATLSEHRHKKFEVNWTKIKGGCQSERKVSQLNSYSKMPLT